MTIDNKIAEFPNTANQPKTVTLDELVQDMNEWRAHKETRGEQIPEEIWQKILPLLKKFPEPTICIALGITKMQLRRKLDEQKYISTIEIIPTKTTRVDFCEAKEIPIPIYKPAPKIPATNTLVVEFCRADGRIMKIHTTTDSFADLMKAFFGS